MLEGHIEPGRVFDRTGSIEDVPDGYRAMNDREAATTFFVDWDESADASVAVLRAEAGRNPHDQDLTNLIGELSTQSEDFRVRWARHDVGTHDTGIKRLHHPLVGHLELAYEEMTLAADPGLVMFAFTPEVGSKSHEALKLLASWAATENQSSAADTSDRY